ncbi:MAG TPA: response regulator [Chryseosolibacter sp.]|nr:response regulator [Chryseosolibacter sp.]
MNVLLVDDDPVFNFVHKKILEGSGFVREVDVALNGEEALMLFNEYFSGTRMLPDLILLDLNMPVMDGFSFLDALKGIPMKRTHNLDIAIVTSSSDPRDIAKAQTYGIKKFMNKPLTPDSFHALVA